MQLLNGCFSQSVDSSQRNIGSSQTATTVSFLYIQHALTWLPSSDYGLITLSDQPAKTRQPVTAYEVEFGFVYIGGWTSAANNIRCVALGCEGGGKGVGGRGSTRLVISYYIPVVPLRKCATLLFAATPKDKQFCIFC